METNEISHHQARIFKFVRDHGGWVTAATISEAADVAARTARMHAKRLSDIGIFDQFESFPGHRYKMSAKAMVRNKAYFMRLQATLEVFGMEPSGTAPSC